MCLLGFSDLKKLFSKIDINNDGVVSIDELTQLLDKVSVYITADELEGIVGKTTLNLQEFVAFYDSISVQLTQEEEEEEEEERSDDDEEEEKYLLEEAFKVFDLNHDGFISCEELKIVLLRFGLLGESSDGDCNKMICRFDLNSDGKLDFEEFKHMMLLNASQ
ncbi:probable calcium-binding protein CML44 [Telopea speciosissima]|uniref:probable calcium-binding protein CML44 n=1 Tax=Telopea speciosissima TaxID=54955 RepID=UPI001CC4CAD1|nr:probable calcium-binding protein CML44 [Telopea speciosissima]